MRIISTLLVLLIVLLSGCVDTSIPQVGTPDLNISLPYDVKPSILEMKIDTEISVPIENTRDGEISVKIIEAKLTAKMKDGSTEEIHGFADDLIIPAHQSRNLTVSFGGLPVKYELEGEPLRLNPLIENYESFVRYKGTATVFWIIPYSKEDTYRRIIEPPEIPIDEKLFTENFS
ncbi:MAG: hypothetical protein COS47_00610 [Candidatus Nealsonbacteria bacterium CG03_land_8_20_14_0_80_36_12]|uniref:Uncharacterized protein n=1 Tax=Candidatus Nealsonbacteria bacterium CG03_land_8_20_14_0_80_36_12 TaxID=1974701 RepID=A0A2M7BYQ7_9BACT|nr:MAG: hypothetical protein COS47_00610 [Candidatus Nealsonbacteria bacterium CG03_land_8_20_14_0_80_36_12]